MLALERRLTDFWFAPRDARALALVRILFAVAAAVNWVSIWLQRDTLLGPHGIIDAFGNDHMPGHQLAFLGDFAAAGHLDLALLIACAAILALGLGLITPLAAVIVAAWHHALFFNMYPALSGYDTILRLTGLVLMVSPCARAFSLDALWQRHRGARPSLAVPAYGLILLQLSVFCIYESSVIQKLARLPRV